MAPSLTDAAPSHTIATPAPIGGDFSIFTSLRYDPQLLNSHANTEASSLSSPTPFYLLSHHRDRMLAAATHFSYPPAAAAILHSLEAFAQRLQEAVDTSAFGGAGPLKLKPVLTREGYFTVETAPIPKVPLSQLFPESLPLHVASSEWEFILDTQPTEPSSFTAFKTTQRDVYDSARARVGLESYAEKKEVLMWNSKREIMEGSLTSIFVWRGEEEGWYAPVVSSGGQQGTSRRWVLETGLAHEGVIKTDELVEGAWVAAGNGVRGFWGGRIA